MNIDDKLFNKIEKKTKVDKNTIINLAKKIEQGNLKDESTLREVIYTLSSIILIHSTTSVNINL